MHRRRSADARQTPTKELQLAGQLRGYVRQNVGATAHQAPFESRAVPGLLTDLRAVPGRRAAAGHRAVAGLLTVPRGSSVLEPSVAKSHAEHRRLNRLSVLANQFACRCSK